jgi:hypothetical protein
MRPLTTDDLLPLDEYASRRREFHEAHDRYLDRYRRVRLGPRATLIFQNRQTLWFHVQELARIARLPATDCLQPHLDAYNRLLPGRGQLQAALVIDQNDPGRTADDLKPWQEFTGNDLRLCVGNCAVSARLVTCRPEDRCLGVVHWVVFEPDAATRRCLADFRQTTTFGIFRGFYSYVSAPVSDEMRQSLLDDLAMSDRDAA